MPKYYDEKAKVRSMRYQKEKRDKLTLDLPKGDKERYREHAENVREKSLTGLIVELLEADIKAAGQDRLHRNDGIDAALYALDAINEKEGGS